MLTQANLIFMLPTLFQRRAQKLNEWIVHLYEGLRAHECSCDEQAGGKQNSCRSTARSHTSDRLQPLTVSVFCPIKKAASQFIYVWTI